MKQRRNQEPPSRQRVSAALTHIKDLVPDPANRRAHNPRNIGMVVDALHHVGAARSIVIDEDNVILAGNGVTEAAAEAGITKVRVVEASGDELIAVRRSGLSPEQKRHLAIADNRSAELAQWNSQQFKADLEGGLDFAAFFTKDELAAILRADPELTSGLTDADAVPAERPTGIVAGDLFELGRHRLLCGDSTAQGDVARLMGNTRAGLMNTDPPYGIDYSKLKDGIPRSGFKNHQAQWGDIKNDTLTDGAALQTFLESIIRIAVPHLTETAAFYLWHPMLTQGTFFAAAAAADIIIHRQIIWKKPGFVLTRSGMYHWAHELCFFGWRRGHQPPWYGPKNQTSVWELGRDSDAGQHPTQKPVALFLPPIYNHTNESESVYEPFAGSGSQFVAAEQTNRACLGIEIEPRYCQTVLDRWEAFTGQKAQKVGEGVRA